MNDTLITVVITYVFLHNNTGYGYLTPGWDIFILHSSQLLRLRQSYTTLSNFLRQQQQQIQLSKLPQTTIIFRIIDGTIRFNNVKYKHAHLVQYVTASNDTLTFYFHFEMPNIYYF